VTGGGFTRAFTGPTNSTHSYIGESLQFTTAGSGQPAAKHGRPHQENSKKGFLHNGAVIVAVLREGHVGIVEAGSAEGAVGAAPGAAAERAIRVAVRARGVALAAHGAVGVLVRALVGAAGGRKVKKTTDAARGGRKGGERVSKASRLLCSLQKST